MSEQSDLLPGIEQRDAVSMAVAKQSSECRSVLDRLTSVEAESLRVSRTNVELASQVLQLAEETGRQNAEPTTGSETKTALDPSERQLRASRQKWRIMKGTASTIVASSGVDWAQDPELREVILDPD